MRDAGVAITPMRESDLTFIRRGLSETNWQDIPEDQRSVLSREDADKRVCEDFDRYRKTEKFKFKVFVARFNDAPVGYISVGELINPDVGIRLGGVIDFWVAPDSRNKGIGGGLFDYALHYIQQQGYSHASIMVSASNKGAIRMYENRGFKPDRIILAKRL